MQVRWLVLAFGVGALVAGTVVCAQPGGRGGRPGGPGGRMRSMPVSGQIMTADIAGGTIQAKIAMFGRGVQEITLYPVAATKLSKYEFVGAETIAVGDAVQVVGAPLAIRAESVRMPLPVEAAATGEDGGPPGGPGMTMAFRGGQGRTFIAGEVTALEPLTVSVDAGEEGAAPLEVTVEVPADASIGREAAAKWGEVVPNAYFSATAEMNDQGQFVLATLTLDESVAEQMAAAEASGAAGGPGGPGGGFGGGPPGGGF